MKSHPLARGLVNFYLLGTPLPRCMITGQGGTPSSTRPTSQNTSGGRGLRGSEGTTTYVDVPARAFSGNEVVTYILGIVPSQTGPTLLERIFDNAVSDNTVPRLALDPTTPRYQFDAGTTPANGTLGIPYVWPAGILQMHCITYDYSDTTSNTVTAGTTRWTRNGLQQTITVVASGTTGANDPAVVRLLGINAAPRGIEGTLLYWGKYGRGLSQSEAIAITTRPWQILSKSAQIWSTASFLAAWAAYTNSVISSGARAA